MTNEQAIEQLEFMLEQMSEEPSTECDYIDEWLDTNRKIRNTLDMAIKALEQETVPREHYEHEFFLRKELDFKVARLEKQIAEQEPCEDCISRANALRVAKNEYLRGWHNALCKALSEKYSIHCEEGNFSVIQEETITGLGLSMDCAVGKDVENYMSALPSVTPTRKKGKWVNKSHTSDCGIKFVASECTCCGKKTFFDCDQLVYNYCPNCGADMENKKAENDLRRRTIHARESFCPAN